MLKPCTQCGTLSNKARCPGCTRIAEQERGTPADRGYNAEHRRLAKQAIEVQPWCSWCWSTQDLTADHIVALKDGGLNVIGNYRVLCRSCNSGRRDSKTIKYI